MRKRAALLIMFVCFAFGAIADAKTYKFNQIFTISVSDNLELRKEDDAYTRFISDTLNYVTRAEIVFQQKGLSQKREPAINQYCRILIKTDSDDSCPYPCSSEGDFSNSDINELVSACTEELAPGQYFVRQPSATIKTNKGGCKYVNITYTRTGYKGEVNVNICYFFNYKYAVKAVFSYRVSESNIWKNAIDNSISSFSWTEPYVSHEYSASEPVTGNSLNSGDSDNDRMLMGVLIGVTLTLVLVGLAHMLKTSRKNKTMRDIESSLSVVSGLISNKKIVSAQKALDSLKVRHGEDLKNFNTIVDKQKNEIGALRNEIDQSINKLLTDLKDDFVNKGGIDLNNSKVDEVRYNQEIPQSYRDNLIQGITSIKEEYNRGIVPLQTECYTNYEIAPCIGRDNYSFYTAPEKGTVVFPYRRKKVELRGYTERGFEEQLRKSIGIYKNYMVLGDVSILTADGYHPYEPDISIVEKENLYGIRVDVEIDEPYSGLEKKPIHFIGCGDEFRDSNLANHGWIVIRFSEKQVYCEPEKCINYIKHILGRIDKSIASTNDFPTSEKRWTEFEATIMALKQYRENLLGHNFGEMEKEETHEVTYQTKEEKSAASQVKPLLTPITNKQNIDRSSQTFDQDRKLSFEPKEHIYLYDGKRILNPVSTIINRFFEPFDSITMSEKVAYKYGRDQYEILEEWDSKGLESREIGTFMHAQIESYFAEKPIYTKTKFLYNGDYLNINKEVSIEIEMEYFKNFLKDCPISPFRTEWHICDLELNIAGTIDLLCRNDNGFDIYDWKRSRKATPDETIWQKGKNGLTHVPDIGFYHYAIQQNLYRYILEHNYGITIKNMYIVVLHPIYDNYRMYAIPRMDKEINIINNHLRSPIN